MVIRRKTAGSPADRKVAVDTLELASLQGQLAAISKTQAVIELQAPSQPIPERRSANRPFTGKPAAARPPVSRAQTASGPVARPMAIANGNDADWREF
jgi:hypothetical protein